MMSGIATDIVFLFGGENLISGDRFRLWNWCWRLFGLIYRCILMKLEVCCFAHLLVVSSISLSLIISNSRELDIQKKVPTN